MPRKSFLMFSAPSNLTMLALMIFPLVMAIWLGMHFLTFQNIDSPQFVGLENYRAVLTDPRFWEAFRFTLLLVVITVPTQTLIGFVMALLLDQISGKLRGVYLSAMLLPFIVVLVVGTLMFKQLFEPAGLMAWFFREILGQRFIFTETSVKALIILHAIWYVTPFPLIVLFAGLQTLPQDLVEASQIDGASRLQQIRYIIIPHLSSLFVMIFLISIMDMYRIFDSVFVLTEQNPVYKADTVMLYTFRVAMSFQRLDKANAMAVLTVIAIMVVLIPFLVRTYHEQIEER